MSIQEQLNRIQEAKTAIRQTIISKGVEVPETAKINEYSDYIAQITGGSAIPDVPDLTKELTAWDLVDIKAIVAAGVADQKFELGQTLLVRHTIRTMPFEIVGFNDIVAQVNGEEKTVHALNLLAGYTCYTTSRWASNSSTKYSESTLRSTIVGKASAEFYPYFLDFLANTKVQTYSQDGTTDIVYDKFFAPSMEELGVTDTEFNTTDQVAVEGPVFTAYQDADNTKRIRNAINSINTAQVYWTRSAYVGYSLGYGEITTRGAAFYGSNTAVTPILLACNLIG